MKGKMNGNKIKGTLLIAVFIISTLAMAIPLVSAIPNPGLSPSNGPVGIEVTVSGGAADATDFGLVEVYWENLGGAKLGEGYAESDGAYSIKITIPEDVFGSNHYVVVKDVATGLAAGTAFTIDPEIVLTPTSGLPGDPVAVAGTGFAEEELIAITFANIAAYEGEAVGTGDGTTTVFQLDYFPVVGASETIYAPGIGEAVWTTVGTTTLPTTITVTAPTTTADFTAGLYDAAGTVELVAPAASTGDDATADTVDLAYAFAASTGYTVKITLTDETGSYDLSDDGDPAGSGGPIVIADDAAYALVDATGVITFTTAPASGVPITADYNFVLDITPDPAPETSVLGSFPATIVVPNVPYADYDIRAVDALNNEYTETFTVTATITLAPDEGPSGTEVDISGIGFVYPGMVDVYLDMNDNQVLETGVDLLLLEDVDLSTGGVFADSFVVPTVSVPTPAGKLYMVFAYDETYTAYLNFNATATTQITLTPTAGAPDSEVTIEGLYFTADSEVTVDFGALLGIETLPTNSTGGFKGTFMVPSMPEAKYDVTATDENDLTVTLTEGFEIAITLIIISPSIGPTGTEITITGYGFTGSADVTFDTMLVIEGMDVDFSADFIVPTVAEGIYTVTYEDGFGFMSSLTFEVDATTELTITPGSAPSGYEVSMIGEYFSPLSPVAFVLYNETYTHPPLTPETGSFTTDEDGILEATFLVPDLSLGNYFINATDTYTFPGGLNLVLAHEVSFSIVEVYRDIHTLLTEYDSGDTVSFYVKATFPFDLEIVIKDPTDFPFTTLGPVIITEWVQMEDYYVVPYAKVSFALPDDAMAGLWNYTAYDDTEMVATGLFLVSGEVPEPPELPAETTGEETLDPTGAPKTSFALGETVMASADVTNVGVESQMMLIVIQLTDPQLRVLPPNYMSMIVPTGLTITPSMSFVLPLTGYTTGTWTAKIMVLDAWPALGGVPIGLPVTITFTVG